jgi:hypothetical protein
MRTCRIVLAVIVLLYGTTALLADPKTDYDHSIDFSRYKTFAWDSEPKTEDPFMVNRLIAAVNRQLSLANLQPDDHNADLLVYVTSTVEERREFNTYYHGFDNWGPGWGWYWRGGFDTDWGGSWGWGSSWATTVEERYLEGTTVVGLMDAARNKLVWRSVSTDTVSSKPAKATKKVVKAIEEMFEDFPPGRDGDKDHR